MENFEDAVPLVFKVEDGGQEPKSARNEPPEIEKSRETESPRAS
jgi:hypothetical protein